MKNLNEDQLHDIQSFLDAQKKRHTDQVNLQSRVASTACTNTSYLAQENASILCLEQFQIPVNNDIQGINEKPMKLLVVP